MLKTSELLTGRYTMSNKYYDSEIENTSTDGAFPVDVAEDDVAKAENESKVRDGGVRVVYMMYVQGEVQKRNGARGVSRFPSLRI